MFEVELLGEHNLDELDKLTETLEKLCETWATKDYLVVFM